MEIAVHGSYYARNFGDTLILSIVVNWVKEEFPEATINLPFCCSIEEAKEIAGPHRFVIDPTLDNSDALVFGPGGYFGQPNFSLLRRTHWFWRNYRRHLIWRRAIWSKKIPYYIVGVGVGPLDNLLFRSVVKQLFTRANFAAVRDVISLGYLKRWLNNPEKVKVTCDVALSVQPRKARVERERKRIGIHYPGTLLHDHNKLKVFCDFLSTLEASFDLFLVEDGPGQVATKDERSVYNYLKRIGKHYGVIEYVSPDDLIAELEKLDYIITSKLHVGILGYSLLKPVLSIPLHQKTSRFYEQIGRAEFCLDVATLSSEGLSNSFNELLINPVEENKMQELALMTRSQLLKTMKSDIAR